MVSILIHININTWTLLILIIYTHTLIHHSQWQEHLHSSSDVTALWRLQRTHTRTWILLTRFFSPTVSHTNTSEKEIYNFECDTFWCGCWYTCRQYDEVFQCFFFLMLITYFKIIFYSRFYLFLESSTSPYILCSRPFSNTNPVRSIHHILCFQFVLH